MSGPGRRVPRAVLDSNVIFSRVLHELFGRAAGEARLFDLLWSDELLAETKRALIEEKPMPRAAAERWAGYLRDAFPSGRTLITECPSDVELATMTNDPDDEHVCALALAGAAQLLITFDDGYVRTALLERGVSVVKPDAVLAPAFDEQPRLFVSILERQAGAWGGRSVPELLDALERADVPQFVDKARAALDL